MGRKPIIVAVVIACALTKLIFDGCFGGLDPYNPSAISVEPARNCLELRLPETIYGEGGWDPIHFTGQNKCSEPFTIATQYLKDSDQDLIVEPNGSVSFDMDDSLLKKTGEDQWDASFPAQVGATPVTISFSLYYESGC